MGINMDNEELEWQDDGLQMWETGPWAEKKYRVLDNYMQMFSSGMKNLWDKRVYVDLYAGCGCVKVESTGKVLKGSPLLALSVVNPFDKYIFCEKGDDKNIWRIDALRSRVKKLSDGKEVEVIDGDCNEKIDEIISKIPKKYGQKVLTFCFVDPFSLDLQFNTLRKLATEHRTDFLVLLALMMDANRNVVHYEKEDNDKIDLFLDDREWRSKWSEVKLYDNSFPRFLANEFENKMISLGYKKSSKGNTIEVRSSEKNLPLYHLAFFSKHERGYDFWNKGKVYSDNQGTLF
jgi:three-Cys-motif partner protein